MYVVGLHWTTQRSQTFNNLMRLEKVARLHGAFVFVRIPEWDLCAVQRWLVAALGQFRDNVAVAIPTMAPSMSNTGDFSDKSIC